MTSPESEVRAVRAELLDAHRERERLRGQTEQLIASNRELGSLLASAARRAGELIKLIVAFRRLCESADAPAVFRSIEEILIDVIGTEDFVVLVVTDEPTLRAVAGVGPAAERARLSPPTLGDLPAEGARVIPLYIVDRVVGAIVIHTVLPQRNPLNADDDQILSLLSHFGASAVMTADRRRFWTRLTASAIA